MNVKKKYQVLLVLYANIFHWQGGGATNSISKPRATIAPKFIR